MKPAVKTAKTTASNYRRSRHFLNSKEKQGVNLFVSQLAEIVKNNILEIMLFGSKVTGKFNLESDIDILLVIANRTWAIQNEICGLATEINLRFGINISPLIITGYEYEKNKSHKTEFAREIALTGIQV